MVIPAGVQETPPQSKQWGKCVKKTWALVVILAEEREESKEYLYDVHVEYNGAVDVLFWRQLVFAAPQQHLSVVHQVLHTNNNKNNKLWAWKNNSHLKWSVKWSQEIVRIEY